MSTRVRDTLMGALGQLRHEPVAKRIRAEVGGVSVLDTTRAVLVWEPRRVVPSYAVPVEDLRADLPPAEPPREASAATAAEVGYSMPQLSQRPVLDPSVPFAVHTAEGQPVDVRTTDQILPGAGLRPADADLAGYVVLDFAAFDAWYEEDERNVGHPRDPFHRIDVLSSSRQIRLELDGELLAQSERPVLLFESMLPARFYLPAEDVRAELTPSPTRSWCAYKGQASYWSATVAGHVVPDLAWTYPSPQREAEQVRDLVCFFDERVDVELDGVRRERPMTPWSTPRR